MTTERRQNDAMDQAMEFYKKLGTPGIAHQLLAGMAGSWSTKTRNWMGPDRPPMEWTGSSEQKIILDGRFLQQEFAGDMMGKLYNGIGFTGYDNHRKKYL